ncbi:Uncharacterised protein [Mycobacteroides abscessus subsp. abscessus]|nr:Uncharacterised protein [Mycobacteroides abscessus subsp. abscessus]
MSSSFSPTASVTKQASATAADRSSVMTIRSATATSSSAQARLSRTRSTTEVRTCSFTS